MAVKKFFMYDPDTGFKTYATAEEAKNVAADAINYYREYAIDEWPDEVSGVCWGEIKQKSQQSRLPPIPYYINCDYELTDISEQGV